MKNSSKKPAVIVVCGATASGKTRLGVDFALEFGGEIISADSMQIYKYMDIATAKPTETEKKGIPHHLMDFLDPAEAFSVADYVRLAKERLNDILQRGKLPIVVGGTGLYISSLVDNITFDETIADYQYRDELRLFAEKNGNAALHAMLAEIDCETAAKLHENNVSRIIRAIEVYRATGKKMSDLQAESRKNGSDYNFVMLAPDFADREVLYERINNRVDRMIETGLIKEARAFFCNKAYPTAAQAIGYKELRPYLDGKSELAECIEELKKETRNYAKRQLTWFRKDKRINWLKMEKCGINEEKSSFYENEYNKILNNGKKFIKNIEII